MSGDCSTPKKNLKRTKTMDVYDIKLVLTYLYRIKGILHGQSVPTLNGFSLKTQLNLSGFLMKEILV